MRTDCTIDNRKIPCPNATLLGYAKGAAKRGDIVTFKHPVYGAGHNISTGRVLGRVSAPRLGDTPRIEGFALVMVLADDCGSAYERWIDPAEILSVHDCPSKFAAWFFQAELPYGPNTMRSLIAHGTVSEQFIDNAPAHVETWQERGCLYQQANVQPKQGKA